MSVTRIHLKWGKDADLMALMSEGEDAEARDAGGESC